ncbi:MAG TPA: hypothetical protein PLN91_00535 [Rhodanobacteraceae bacterium]|nr:hypothetical protein [Rhodanobacteraceae bacterium]
MTTLSDLEAFRIRKAAMDRRISDMERESAELTAKIAERDSEIAVAEADIAKDRGRRELARMRLKGLMRRLDSNL